MFDEKLAANHDVLDNQNLEQGWSVEGPHAQGTNPTTTRNPNQAVPMQPQTPRVVQVDTGEPQDLVNGITTAVGQVATEVQPAIITLDLNGRPLNVPISETTNPKVRQAIQRMETCRETYKNLTPDAVAEENADINRRLSQKYRTDCQLPGAGGQVSKSYFYDSKTIERMELDIKQVLLESDVPRSTIIEICRLRDPEDQRAIVFDILDKNLSCRETRQVVQLVVKLRSRPGTNIQDHLTQKLANLLRNKAPFLTRLT